MTDKPKLVGKAQIPLRDRSPSNTIPIIDSPPKNTVSVSEFLKDITLSKDEVRKQTVEDLKKVLASINSYAIFIANKQAKQSLKDLITAVEDASNNQISEISEEISEQLKAVFQQTSYSSLLTKDIVMKSSKVSAGLKVKKATLRRFIPNF